MAGNGWKWLAIAVNGCAWLKIAGNGWKCQDMLGNVLMTGIWLKIADSVKKWLETAENYCN